MKCQLTVKGKKIGKKTVQKHPKKFKTWLVNGHDKGGWFSDSQDKRKWGTG